MHDILEDYFKALERLIRGNPVNVPRGTKITNDAVSLEAGRKKGTIKRSRPIFKALIEAIDTAANAEIRPRDEMRERLDDAKAEAARCRKLWEEAVAREVSLFNQLWNERQEWAKEKAALTGEKVASINSKWLKQPRQAIP